MAISSKTWIHTKLAKKHPRSRYIQIIIINHENLAIHLFYVQVHDVWLFVNLFRELINISVVNILVWKGETVILVLQAISWRV